MKAIRIRILFSDHDYAGKLARRLCEIYPGLRIEVGETDLNSKWDILLADRPQRPDDLLQAACFVELTSEEYFLPAPAILEKMLDAYGICSSRTLFRTKGDPTQILVFSASVGGAGTTAAALTLGRILAGASEKGILYLSAGTGRRGRETEADWRAYTKITEPARRPAAELAYRLLRQESLRLPSYLAKDLYGLHYLSLPMDAAQKLLQQPELTADFKTVIADCGTLTEDRLPGICFRLVNRHDSRSHLLLSQEDGEAEDGIRIENRGRSYQEEGSAFVLTDDPQSFVPREDRGRPFVEILQSGVFARDVRRMAKALLFLTQ